MKGKAALLGLIAWGSAALMPSTKAMLNGLPQAEQLSGSAPKPEQVR
jgi:hypothetical protein